MEELTNRSYIDVLMPIKEGRFIPQEVLEGLIRQDIPFRLWTSTAVSDGDYAKARNHIKQYACSNSYSLMLDNDIILPGGALSMMIAFLNIHADYAAVALRKQSSISHRPSEPIIADEPDHVDMSCVLFRTNELLSLNFAYPGGDSQTRQGCECFKACQDIRDAGKRIGFIRGINAEHIHDTEQTHPARPRGDWR
jgi:hypothetical protein